MSTPKPQPTPQNCKKSATHHQGNEEEEIAIINLKTSMETIDSSDPLGLKNLEPLESGKAPLLKGGCIKCKKAGNMEWNTHTGRNKLCPFNKQESTQEKGNTKLIWEDPGKTMAVKASNEAFENIMKRIPKINKPKNAKEYPLNLVKENHGLSKKYSESLKEKTKNKIAETAQEKLEKIRNSVKRKLQVDEQQTYTHKREWSALIQIKMHATNALGLLPKENNNTVQMRYAFWKELENLESLIRAVGKHAAEWDQSFPNLPEGPEPSMKKPRQEEPANDEVEDVEKQFANF